MIPIQPKHHMGRNVRGCSLTCDDCGDEFELRAHGEGVRGDNAARVASELTKALQDLAEAVGWWIRPTQVAGALSMRHSCPRCRRSPTSDPRSP